MTETNHQIALEAGPYFWNAETIFQFFMVLFKILKPAVDRSRKAEIARRNGKEVETPKRVEDRELDDFVTMLSQESTKVFGNSTWVDILGTCVFDILKCNEKGEDTMHIDKDTLKKACVVQLLKLIRHKIEHILDYSDEVKQKLPMCFGGGKESQNMKFKERFVSYWITKFPTLVSFFWVKFYKFKDDLESYYPLHPISKDHDFSLMPIHQPNNLHVDLNDVVDLLNEALITHLEKGRLFYKL